MGDAGVVAEQKFRADLYYRVNAFPVHLPALRERAEDVLELADHFLGTLGTGMGKGEVRLSADARDALLSYEWPGNVRELGNVIERALIVSDGEVITRDHLLFSPAPTGPEAPPLGWLTATDRTVLVNALREAGNNRVVAARILGISRSHLYRQLRHAGLIESKTPPPGHAPAHATPAGLTDHPTPERQART
jgi:two-component system, NtrC family, response regulator HydG